MSDAQEAKTRRFVIEGMGWTWNVDLPENAVVEADRSSDGKSFVFKASVPASFDSGGSVLAMFAGVTSVRREDVVVEKERRYAPEPRREP